MLDKDVSENESLTAEQQQLLQQWETDYKNWLEQESEVDYEAESRKRAYATALAMILVGAPVFAVHVPFVFRQVRE